MALPITETIIISIIISNPTTITIIITVTIATMITNIFITQTLCSEPAERAFIIHIVFMNMITVYYYGYYYYYYY